MRELIIKRNRLDMTDIYLKYDEQKYNIEYSERKNILILRRLSDNEILGIFSDRIGFIVQCDINEEANFLVTDYSEIDKNNDVQVKFKHYIDRYAADSLYLKKQFRCDTAHYQQCHITDSSYLIEQPYVTIVYNLDKSKKFERVYYNEKINEIIGANTLLVTEKLNATLNYEISDTITYGINPETFEITTRIWSEEQQRYIDVYTKDQVEKIDENLRQKGHCLNMEDFTLGDITIELEIQKYLNLSEKYLNKSKSVYLDYCGDKVNEEFVKTFIKTKQN